MSHTVLVNPAILSLLGDNMDGLQLLAEWLLIEATYPNGAGRPNYLGRVAGAKKTGLSKRFSGAKVTIEVDVDKTFVSLDGNETKKELFVTLDDIMRQLAREGRTAELPAPKQQINKPQPIIAAQEVEDREEMNENFRRMLPTIKEHTLVLGLIDSIVDRKEKLFAQERVAKYLRDFPELNIAPDETLIATLIINEITMFRLQHDVAHGKAVSPQQIEKAQSNWFSAANSLGVTRAQRLKQGDAQGTSIADLSAQYDDLQRQALKQFEQDVQEEAPVIERAQERKIRELAPGMAASILREGFGIEVDEQRSIFAMEEEADGGS